MDVPGLPDAMTPILRLRIHRGIPVTVVEHHRIGPCQVYPHPARPRAEDEAEVLGAVVETLHEGLTHLHLGGAVQPHVDIAVVVEEGLQDVQHAGHLGEDQHTVAATVQIPGGTKGNIKSSKGGQCCGSKYVEFGSGSRIWPNLDPNPGLCYKFSKAPEYGSNTDPDPQHCLGKLVGL